MDTDGVHVLVTHAGGAERLGGASCSAFLLSWNCGWPYVKCLQHSAMLWFSVDCFISQGREAGEAEPLTATAKDKLWHGGRGSFPPDPCLAASAGFGAAPQGLALSLL